MFEIVEDGGFFPNPLIDLDVFLVLVQPGIFGFERYHRDFIYRGSKRALMSTEGAGVVKYVNALI